MKMNYIKYKFNYFSIIIKKKIFFGLKAQF